MARVTTPSMSLLALLVAVALAGCASNAAGPTTAAGGATAANGSSATAPTTGPATTASSDGGAKNVDGCQVVTAADAEAVFGVPMAKEDTSTKVPQMMAECVWDGGPGTGVMALVDKMLQFRLWDGAMFYAPDAFKDQPGFEKIDGLGDGAFAYGTGSFDMEILVGDRTVGLAASGFTPDQRAAVRKAVLDLAPKVLDRI